jgi:hypothetical protein
LTTPHPSYPLSRPVTQPPPFPITPFRSFDSSTSFPGFLPTKPRNPSPFLRNIIRPISCSFPAPLICLSICCPLLSVLSSPSDRSFHMAQTFGVPSRNLQRQGHHFPRHLPVTCRSALFSILLRLSPIRRSRHDIHLPISLPRPLRLHPPGVEGKGCMYVTISSSHHIRVPPIEPKSRATLAPKLVGQYGAVWRFPFFNIHSTRDHLPRFGLSQGQGTSRACSL